jgi:Domain of unknown function (DUF6306)
VQKALEQMLNLLLESERAGMVALEQLAREVEHEELSRFLLGERDEEARNVKRLDALIRQGGGTPSERTGPFAQKVAAAGSIRERLNLMSRGQEWVARKIEQTLLIAPAKGPLHDHLQAMANRHRAEVEWGRAEVIRLLGSRN